MVIPRVKEEAEARKQMDENLATYLEETWIHRPLKSLNQIPPSDAAGHDTLGKKLAGVVEFLQECAAVSGFGYDSARLRGKLGLTGDKPTPAGPAAQDITVLSTAELAGLALDSLSDE